MGVNTKDGQGMGITRRDFIKGMGAMGAAAVLNEVGSQIKGKPSLRQQVAQFFGFGASRRLLPKVEAMSDLKERNNILSMPLQTQERFKAEQDYVNKATTLEKIDKAFEVVTDWQLRARLLDTRWQKRVEGKEEETGLRKLTSEEIDWAKENKVHPEVLAICTGLYFEAYNKAEQQQKQLGQEKFMQEFRPEVVDAYKRGELETLDIPLEQMFPSPGTMVGIVMNETKAGPAKEGWMYGFANIGTKPALTQLNIKNPGIQLKVKQQLYKLIEELSKNGLSYKVDNIPGSDKIDNPEKEIGGDIGMQFRPDTALELFYSLKKDFNLSFNPFSINAPLAAYLMLFKGQKFDDGSYRYGYLRNDNSVLIIGKRINVKEAFRIDALRRWNPALAMDNLSWGESYSKRFIPAFFDKYIAPRYKVKGFSSDPGSG